MEEVNKEPVVYHWSYKLDEISKEEAEDSGVKSNENLARSLLFDVPESVSKGRNCSFEWIFRQFKRK